jgi:hypothetical protein
VTHTNAAFAAETFSYDANGNRTTAGTSTGTGNRLEGDGTFTYQYDDEGNLAVKTESATSKQTLLTWDHRNRLVAVDSQVGGVTTPVARYTYDALDRRIQVVAGATTRWTAYDGAAAVLDFDGVQPADRAAGPAAVLRQRGRRRRRRRHPRRDLDVHLRRLRPCGPGGPGPRLRRPHDDHPAYDGKGRVTRVATWNRVTMSVMIALAHALAYRVAVALIDRLPRIHASGELRFRAHCGNPLLPRQGRARRRRGRDHRR